MFEIFSTVHRIQLLRQAERLAALYRIGVQIHNSIVFNQAGNVM